MLIKMVSGGTANFSYKDENQKLFKTLMTTSKLKNCINKVRIQYMK